MGNLIYTICLTISGLGFSMSRGWNLALVILAAFPLISLATHYMSKTIESGIGMSL
jgi:hypothetical protein